MKPFFNFTKTVFLVILVTWRSSLAPPCLYLLLFIFISCLKDAILDHIIALHCLLFPLDYICDYLVCFVSDASLAYLIMCIIAFRLPEGSFNDLDG